MALAGTPASMVSALMTKGRASAAALEALLQGVSPPPPGGLQELASQVLRCCDSALEALHSGGEVNVAGAGGDRKRKLEPGSNAIPVTVRSRKRVRRAELPTRVEKKWTTEDGFIWRKYGHKEILSSKYPRLYFRCTYKHDHGCAATRQVQQSEDNPSLYVITYFGEHTCSSQGAMDDEESQPFIINFGSGTASCRGQRRGGSAWPCSRDDVRSDSSPVKVSSEVAELEEMLTPVAEPRGSSLSEACHASQALESWDGCLDLEFGDGPFDFGDLIGFDPADLFQ